MDGSQQEKLPYDAMQWYKGIAACLVSVKTIALTMLGILVVLSIAGVALKFNWLDTKTIALLSIAGVFLSYMMSSLPEIEKFEKQYKLTHSTSFTEN